MAEDSDGQSSESSTESEAMAESSSLSSLADAVTERETGDDAHSEQQPDAFADLVDVIQNRDSGSAASSHSSPETDSEWGLLTHNGRAAGESTETDPKTEAILELIEDESNLLIVGPENCPTEQNLCTRLIDSVAAEPVNFLLVTINSTPNERLTVLQNYLTQPVVQTVVIDVQTYSGGRDRNPIDEGIEVKTVSDPTDLRRLGILMSQILSDWNDGSNRTAVCFHSLSDLLEVTNNTERMFRFLHILQGRIESVAATAHYHLDESQLNDKTLKMFQSQFSTIFRFDQAGSISLE